MMANVNEVAFAPAGEIESKADSLRERLGLTRIPIDPVVVANKLGIRVHFAAFSEEDIVGMISRRGSEKMILVRYGDAPTRTRFTIAHEIGHEVLHLESDQELVDCDSDLFRLEVPRTQHGTNRAHQEAQANRFAAALLMPAKEVRTLWPQIGSVREMARLFQVSEEAMGFRLSALGLI